PALAAGPLPGLPTVTTMPLPPGKLVMSLPLISALVISNAVLALPLSLKKMPEPEEVLELVLLVIVLFEMLASVIVPASEATATPLRNALVSVLPVTVSVPLMLLPVPLPNWMLENCEPAAAPAPLLLMVPLVKAKFVTPVPLIPLWVVSWMFI